MNVHLRVRISCTHTYNINYSSTRSDLSEEEYRSENCKCKWTFKSFHAAFLRVILFCNIPLQLLMVLVYKGMMVNEFSHIFIYLCARWSYSANMGVPQDRILQRRCGKKLKILHYAFCTELAILCKMSADNTSPHE
jgi:hypothetical protein